MSSQLRNKGVGLALVGLLALAAGVTAYAAPESARTAPQRGGSGFLGGLDRSVGLTPEQKDAVRGLLAEQRKAAQAMREQTDVKIRAILTPDQRKKFDDFLAQQKNRRAWKPAAN